MLGGTWQLLLFLHTFGDDILGMIVLLALGEILLERTFCLVPFPRQPALTMQQLSETNNCTLGQASVAPPSNSTL